MKTTHLGKKISPFEFKDELIHLASMNQNKPILNAGRGNPNFLAIQPRYAFFRLGDFALQESQRAFESHSDLLGGMPQKKAINQRFEDYLKINNKAQGIALLQDLMQFAQIQGLDKETLVYELVLASLGCNYAEPPRMLPCFEKLMRLYLTQELCQGNNAKCNFDVFATEGASAAIAYLFRTLQINGLLKKKDKVAVVTPVFTPYLEIPRMPEYELEVIEIKTNEENNWQVPDSEFSKLLDAHVKVLFLINPTNPSSVKMNDEFLQKITALVNKQRKDLMIISDDVYAPFSNNYHSLFSVCPYNTLCIYSFSKYFGVTGWRLGTVLLHKNNVFDQLLAKLPEVHKQYLSIHYESLSESSHTLSFMDRLVAESRAVVLNHTAGLSLPQQLQMILMAMYALLDTTRAYNNETKALIKKRYDILYHAIGLSPTRDENSVDYYKILDLELLAESLFNREFAGWIAKEFNSLDFTARLAKEASVVLLPGKGFDIEHPSARVSMANLSDDDYQTIGLSIKSLLHEYYLTYEQNAS